MSNLVITVLTTVVLIILGYGTELRALAGAHFWLTVTFLVGVLAIDLSNW